MTENKISWRNWNPGLLNGDKTLREVNDTLPGNEDSEINFWVRLLENPKSPIAFKGAVNLERHDIIHIILGRGLLPQDEAFVIGFTMGTSKKISNLQVWLFKKAAQYLYPHPYNFSEENLKVFQLALDYGKKCDCFKIYKFPMENYYDYKLSELRKILNIDINELSQIYQQEKLLIPDSVESARLLRGSSY